MNPSAHSSTPKAPAKESPGEVESLFGKKAATWNEKYSVNGPLCYRLDAFGRQLWKLVKPPANVLDFGCGTGNLACHLSKCGFIVKACDISSKMIQQAKEGNPDEPVDWFVLSGECRELPFPPNAFDAIVASSVLEYLTDIRATFIECRRILKPNGFLIATVPNSRSLIRKLENLLRPAAMIASKMPILNQVRRLEAYASYLKCSRNRMPLDEWFAIGNRARFTVVKQQKSFTSNTPLVFVVFRKTGGESAQHSKKH